jgi:hypothetical protein
MNGYQALMVLKDYIITNYHSYLIDNELTDFIDADCRISAIDIVNTNPVVINLLPNETVYNDASNTSDYAVQSVNIFITIRGGTQEVMQENISYYLGYLRNCLYKCNDLNIIVSGTDTFDKINELEKITNYKIGVLNISIGYEEDR